MARHTIRLVKVEEIVSNFSLIASPFCGERLKITVIH